MKKIIYIVIFTAFILSFFIKDKYIELNNLVIVEGIGLECSDEEYNIYLKEIIPVKDDSGIEYEYKYYNVKSDELNKSYSMFDEKISKEIYYDNTKYVITNCTSTKKLIYTYNINPKYIIHTNKNIKKELNDYS